MTTPELPEFLAQATLPSEVMEVISTLRRKGHRAYLVGGSVRDLLRGLPPKDFDVATSARPEEVQQAFRKVIPTGIQHGTVTVMLRGHPIEVTTFRVEGAYVDGRRPSSVSFHTEIDADLSRRDFTINAMAFDPDGRELVDPFGGLEDLRLRRIRCVGVARDRFDEDGLRALRAVRFSAVLGFSLDPATKAAIPATLHVFRKVAAERMFQELQKLLLSQQPAEGLDLLRSTGLLGAMLPELSTLDEEAWRLTSRMVAASAPRLEERFAALLHATPHPGPALVRLKPPAKLLEDVEVLAREQQAMTFEPPPTDVALRQLAARVGRERAPRVLELASARLDAAGRSTERARCDEARARLASLLAENPPLSARELALDGAAVMRVLAVPPSPRVGEATRHLLMKVLEDPARNSPETLTQLLLEWAAGRSS